MELSDLQFAVVQQNKINELERYLRDIQLLIIRPANTFYKCDNPEVDYIMSSIIKMQKELKELREFKDNTTGHTVKE